jgi:AcrR family transcriptional regulator
MPRPSGRLPRLPPGRQTISRELVTAHQRDRILDAATELFGEQGYPDTTLEQITKKARIAWATLYQSFDTKEDVYLGAFDRAVDGAAERVAEALAPEEAWPDRASTAIETILSLIVADPVSARLCLVEFQSAGPRARARYEALIERLAAGLRQGREFNLAGSRPERLEESIVGGIAWLIQGSLAKGDISRLRALPPEILQIALTPYLGEDEAGRRALAARG